MIADEPVTTFLDTVASSSPTPGGGSVGAICGAAGAALVAMVARLTQGHKGFEAVSGRMSEIAAQADEERAAFLDLADRDAAAFDAVMAAFGLPKAADEEKAARSAAIQAAFAGAAAVPAEVARRAAALLDVAVEVTRDGNPDAASDGLSAAASLHAAVMSALANVEINAMSIKDQSVARNLRASAAGLRARAAEMFDSALRAFEERTKK